MLVNNINLYILSCSISTLLQIIGQIFASLFNTLVQGEPIKTQDYEIWRQETI